MALRTRLTVSLVATASYSGVESSTRRTPTRPAALATSRRPLEDPVGTLGAGEARPHVDEHRVGEARGIERQATRRVLPAGVEGEPLHGLPVGQALEALEDHHDRDDEGRHRAAADVREQVVEQVVGEQRVALAGEQGMDRVRPDERLNEGPRVTEEVGLAGCGSLRHRCAPAISGQAVGPVQDPCPGNRSCAGVLRSVAQNARFTPAT